MAYQNLRLNRLEDGIYEFVISNPSKRNALNAQMWADMPSVLKDAEGKADLKVLIVRGEGDHFASGADISEFETLYATRQSSEKISKNIAAGFDSLASFPLPTIGMIRGACVGGGCGLAMCTDIRFADNTSKFAVTPAKLGLVYPYADLQRLIEAVGIPNAKDLMFSARAIKSKRAEKMGLINKVFKPDDLEHEVLEYARAMTKLSTQSARVTKQMFAAYQSGQFGDNAVTLDWFLDGFSSDDFQEGYRAFMEKRRPVFSRNS